MPYQNKTKKNAREKTNFIPKMSKQQQFKYYRNSTHTIRPKVCEHLTITPTGAY